MVGMVERRISKSAIWCRRLALFALPYFLATIIMHRLENITSSQAVGLMAVGFLILVISILFAIHAFVQLWNDGARGGRNAIFGLFLSIVMLTPFMIFAVFAMRYPAINDLATNVDVPPQFSEKTLALRQSLGVLPENDIGSGFADEDKFAIAFYYPKISPRRYPAGPERVLLAVNLIIEDRGWKITDIRGLSQSDEDDPQQQTEVQKGTKKSAKTSDQQKVSKQDNGLEVVHSDDILVDAVYSTLFLSFKNDIVVQIVSEEENTLVQMRSAGRWSIHDFGENARIIEKFMRDLDQNLIGIAGEG